MPSYKQQPGLGESKVVKDTEANNSSSTWPNKQARQHCAMFHDRCSCLLPPGSAGIAGGYEDASRVGQVGSLKMVCGACRYRQQPRYSLWRPDRIACEGFYNRQRK
jgi:hypothetical protein